VARFPVIQKMIANFNVLRWKRCTELNNFDMDCGFWDRREWWSYRRTCVRYTLKMSLKLGLKRLTCFTSMRWRMQPHLFSMALKSFLTISEDHFSIHFSQLYPGMRFLWAFRSSALVQNKHAEVSCTPL
jgi:hypothetical protein